MVEFERLAKVCENKIINGELMGIEEFNNLSFSDDYTQELGAQYGRILHLDPDKMQKDTLILRDYSLLMLSKGFCLVILIAW